MQEKKNSSLPEFERESKVQTPEHFWYRTRLAWVFPAPRVAGIVGRSFEEGSRWRAALIHSYKHRTLFRVALNGRTREYRRQEMVNFREEFYVTVVPPSSRRGRYFTRPLFVKEHLIAGFAEENS